MSRPRIPEATTAALAERGLTPAAALEQIARPRRPAPQRTTARVDTRVPPEVRQQLDQLAERWGLSLGETIARLVREAAGVSSASKRDQRTRFRAAGLCPECGSAPRPGGVLCEACLAKARAVMQRRRDRRAAAGVCAWCPEPAASDRGLCEAHLREASKASKRQRAKRRAAGLCNYCDQPAEQGYLSCLTCRTRYRDLTRDRRAKDGQISPSPPLSPCNPTKGP